MTGRKLEIVPCPPTLNLDALALVLGDLTPQQRREYVMVTCDHSVEGLFVALAAKELCGAAWGQRQPGNTAVLWPPRLVDGHDREVERRLAESVASALDAAGICMTQVLLHDRAEPPAATFRSAGFEFLADLLYLSWESAAVAEPADDALEFETFCAAELDRLTSLIEKTYEATQDCAALGGKRSMEDVLAGYQATGVYHPENWVIVREAGRDIGVLLLADHPAARHWELLYMGVVPAARGRKLGHSIARHAQRMARAAGAERIVLAVDAENIPAIKMYNETGFTAWDRRTVFVRFAATDSQTQKAP